jgi:hypothetical protein
MLPPSGLTLSSTISTSRHSICTGDSLTRCGLTTSLAIPVKRETSNSSTSGGYSPEHRFIWREISSLTMLTTNSLVSRTLFNVSFVEPFGRTIGQKQITGGFALAPVKKLNGARFETPAALIVETKAIGLGTITPIIT